MVAYRFARPDEFDAVLAFYTRMIDLMPGTDFDVCWKHGVHPSPAFLRESVAAGGLLMGVAASGELAGDDEAPLLPSGERLASAMVLNGEGAPGYEGVSWLVDAAPGEAWVLHVVATLPCFHGRGLAEGLVRASIDAAREAGKKSLRLDTFISNKRGQRLYEKCGFQKLGDYPIVYDELGTLPIRVYELPLLAADAARK